jgi:hypothetical protein
MYQFMIVRAFSYCRMTAVGGGESSISAKGYP